MTEGKQVVAHHFGGVPDAFRVTFRLIQDKTLYDKYTRFVADFREHRGIGLEELTEQEFTSFLTAMQLKDEQLFKDIMQQLDTGYSPSDSMPSLIAYIEGFRVGREYNQSKET